MTAPQPTGIHHIAIMAADIKKHIAFFSDVVGFPLVALFDMHGVPGGLHAFMRMNDHSYFSIVQLAGVDAIPVTLGVTHAGRGDQPSAAGTMQHLAFRADSEAELLAMRDRIRSRGVNVIGPLDHGFCKSIYFAGPDSLTLEVAASTSAINPALWTDPTTLAKAGISAEEAALYAAPAPYDGPGNEPQPPYDPDKPHLTYPPEHYRAILGMTDAMVSAAGSYNKPPVEGR
jgi:catechol 2,3-dioxygenase-like lactoylglutathione lyase family enzyme